MLVLAELMSRMIFTWLPNLSMKWLHVPRSWANINSFIEGGEALFPDCHMGDEAIILRHFTKRELLLASFPGPTQLSIAYSTEKRGEPGIFSREHDVIGKWRNFWNKLAAFRVLFN